MTAEVKLLTEILTMLERIEALLVASSAPDAVTTWLAQNVRLCLHGFIHVSCGDCSPWMMSDRAAELAREFVSTNAKKIMVDTNSGDRRVYVADEWREQIASALRAYAEEARREEREACAAVADNGGPDAPWNGRDREELENLRFGAERIAAEIRARGEEKR